MPESAFGLLKQAAAEISPRAVSDLLSQDPGLTPARLMDITLGRVQEFAFRNPVLLQPGVRAELSRQVDALNDREWVKQLRLVLSYLGEVWSVVYKDPAAYYVGIGPLEKLSERVTNGEITLDTAEGLAQEAPVTESLSGPYLRRLSGYSRGGAYEGRWRLSVQQEKIIRAATNALPHSEEWDKVRDDLDLDWIEIVHVSLQDIPDGRLYRSATAAGERVIERAKRMGDNELLGEVSHLLGTMHLDPYSANYINVNYEQQIDRWLRKLHDELGDAITRIPDEELKMPSPVEALGLAVQHLSQAVKFRKQSLRGFSLKALAQANTWLEVASGQSNLDDEELSAPAKSRQEANRAVAIKANQEALAAISKEKNPDVWAATFDQLVHLGEKPDFTQLHDLLKSSFDDFVSRVGGRMALDLIQHAASALSGTDPVRSLELFSLSRPVAQRYADSQARSKRSELELNILIRGLAPGRGPVESVESIRDQAQKFREEAHENSWDATKLAGGLIRLAAISSNVNAEELGLSLLEEAIGVAPIFADNHTEALGWLRANLHLGEGVNGYDRKDWRAAIAGYTRALAEYLRLRLDDQAMNTLRRINDIAFREGEGVALEFAHGLVPLALRIENQLGAPARNLVLSASRLAIASYAKERMNVQLTSLIWQMAKGLRFSAALTSGFRYHATGEDELGKSLLDQIREFPIEQRLDWEDDQLIEETLLLTPYVSGAAAEAGRSDQARLANLQRAYDRHFTARQMANVPVDDPPYASIDAIQASLDERTVLLNYYLGMTPERKRAIYVLAVTRESVRPAAITWDVPFGEIQLSTDRATVEADAISFYVAHIREQIQAYAGPSVPLNQAATESLTGAFGAYFGDLAEYLEQCRADGKDHLCIIPHGSLHFLPFQAILQDGKPLAEKWIVTYLPNMGLLFSYRGGPTIPPDRDREITVAGMTFERVNPFGLPPLKEARAEAEEIATLFETEPILEEQVTRSVLEEALQHSRYVHLSTHGQHNVAAPAFQSLFIAPDETSDGSLCAYELRALDLRGVEVLTLSACETALGRFDPGDNLRGLPASFLLSGVSTVIGTLWNVETDVSKSFFVAFYRHLKAGLDRRNAFGKAQREIRETFPRYAHWAAFYYMGAWK